MLKHINSIGSQGQIPAYMSSTNTQGQQ